MTADPLAFARALIAQGVPVFVAPPDAAHPVGFRLPSGWQATKASPRALDDWQPGWAVAALGGHGIDVIDVDPRNGGDVAAAKLRAEGKWPREYAIVATPSGGTHHYVYGLGAAKTKRDGIDLQAGAPDGTGRGFVFLPGTQRVSKVDGLTRGYVLAVDQLDTFGVNDNSGQAFLSWVQNGNGSVIQLPGVKSHDLGGSGPTALERFAEPVQAGSHDEEGAKLAAALARLGFAHDDALAILRVRVGKFVGGDPRNPFTDRDLGRWWAGAQKFAGAPMQLEVDPDTGEVHDVTASSWAPLDPDDIDGAAMPPPAFLLRTDGHGLLYASEVNGLIGESESGKSWVAQFAVAQALLGGLPCAYYDFESRYAQVHARMVTLGVSTGVLRERFRYASPDEPLTLEAKRHRDDMATWAAKGVLVVDGVNAAMDLLGLDSNSTNEATRFWREVLMPLAGPGAAVLFIDHIPKTAAGQSTRGAVGSQSKRGMTSGAILRVGKVKEMGRGKDGLLALEVDKDRPGHVRGISEESKKAGLFLAKSTITGALECSVIPQGAGSEFAQQDAAVSLDARILDFLDEIGPASGNVIEKNVRGGNEEIRQRLEALRAAGAIAREPHGQHIKYVRLTANP